MKGIKAVELLAEIKANLVAFISIVMFVALGLGLFYGIHWGATAVMNTAHDTFEAGNLHDIEVQFPYGITDENIERIEDIEGVSAVEAGYTDTVRLAKGDVRYVLKMQSLTDDIDVATVVDGELPTKKGEVALLDFWAENNDVHIGDTITLEHDATDKDDKDGMAHLTEDSYKVVGLVRHPAYVSNVKGMLGIATIGSGSIDCVAFTTDDAFDGEAYFDAHPCLYIRCDSLRGKNTYSKEYKAALDPIVNAVTDLGGELSLPRYNKVRADIREELDDAQKEVADGEKELTEGKDKIDDGDSQLADGKKQVSEGEEKLEEGRQQLEEGEAAMAEGKTQLDEGDQKFAEGERQLAEGEEQLNAGDRKLTEGEKELSRRKAEGATAAAQAEKEFAAAKKRLEDGQSQYDAAKAQYDESKSNADAAAGAFNSVRSSYDAAIGNAQSAQIQQATLESDAAALDSAVATYKQVNADAKATDAEKDGAWGDVTAAYQAVQGSYDSANANLASLASNVGTVCGAIGASSPVSGSLSGLSGLDRGNPDGAVSSAYAAASEIGGELGALDSPIVNGYSFYGIPEMIDSSSAQLGAAEAELAQAKKELDEGWKQYNTSKAEYDKQMAEGAKKMEGAEKEMAAGRKTINEKRKEINDAKTLMEEKRGELEAAHKLFDEKTEEIKNGKGTIAEKAQQLFQAKLDIIKAEKELDDAKKKYEDGVAELEEGKAELADAEADFGDMIHIDWIVMPRFENAGVEAIKTSGNIMNNVSWAMASLFVLVGLFVCYSAVSRLVYNEAVQVGTKKAIGFREGEVASLYLTFTAIAVVTGTLLAVLMGFGSIEPAMNPKAAANFVLQDVNSFFSLKEMLIGGGLELTLILASTWLACHSLLKRDAVQLLSGNRDDAVKEHFFERWGIWKRMSLYSQTIVNNVINDKRRVVATIVGVTACTALIVTAITLQDNVSRSIERHYDAIYNYNTIAYVDEDVDTALGDASKILEDEGHEGKEVHIGRMQVRQPDGSRTMVRIVTPKDREGFDEVYHTLDDESGEKADLDVDGVWVSAAFSDHLGIKPGDTVTLTEFAGKSYDVPVAGVMEYYVMQHEFVMTEEQYAKYFEEAPETNALLTNVSEEQFDDLNGKLADVEGFDALVKDEQDNRMAFDEIAGLMTIIVIVYIVLSALMAIIVLLNLDIMFVEEKKRELIVLMINGYSSKDAKAYIYRDSIVLTVIGILLGIVLGSFTGNLAVKALEPSYGHFISGFNGLAAGVGILGSTVFSAAVLLYALRKIPRFDLTDINRF